MVNDGYVGLRVSEATHALLKQEARGRSMSMHELILVSVRAYTGKDAGQPGLKGLSLNKPIVDLSPVLEAKVNAYCDAHLNGQLAPGGAMYEAVRRAVMDAKRQLTFNERDSAITS